MFFLGVLFSLPLWMATVILPHRATFGETGLRLRLLILVTLSTFIGLSFTVFLNVHYAAPLTGAIYFLMLLGMQWLRRWKCRGERIGLAIVRSTVTICVLLFVLRAVTLGLHFADPWGEPIWFSREPEAPGRAKVLSDLADRPDKLLVLVRYHVPRDREQALFSWVNNGADIDSSKIVWAHDMGPDKIPGTPRLFSGKGSVAS